MTRWLLAVFIVCAVPARASGFYFGDNGSKALIQGGAFTAQADDLSAMQYNPAGLAQQRGLSFLLDGQLMSHSVSFLRQDNGYDPANPSTLIRPVSNTGGAFLLPMVGLSYGFPIGPRTLSVTLGVYGPPSVGRYRLPEPNYTKGADGKFVDDPRRAAPQRYTLINNDILIYYPTLSVAMDVHPKFLIGASFQLVGAHFSFRQALFAGDAIGLNPMRQLEEDATYDAVAKIDLTGRVGFTGVLGALYKPLSWLAIGASVRPPVPIRATGTMDLTLSDTFKSFGASVSGNQAEFTLALPLEIRVGARFTPPVRGLGVNVDFVYLGWQSVDAFVLTPKDVTLVVAGSDPSAVKPIRIPRNWQASFSVRAGASYDIVKWVTVHGGAMYETSAAPDAMYSVDFAHPDRLFLSAGLTAHLGPIDVVGGASFTPPVTKDITASNVRRAQSNPGVEAGVAGAGRYVSGGYSATLGIRGHFAPF